MRVIYAAGINRHHLAHIGAACDYWLLSASLVATAYRRTGGIGAWLLEHGVLGRQVMWDPGTFVKGALSFVEYLRFLEATLIDHPDAASDWRLQYGPVDPDEADPGEDYLAYDVPGDPDATARYLAEMRRLGFDPIPVLQRGMDPALLETEPRVAIGGLVRLSPTERMAYLDGLLYPGGRRRRIAGQVHLLGIAAERYFRRYPAASGDSSTWLPRGPWNQQQSMEQWLAEHYGARWIPYAPPQTLQMRLTV